MVVRHIKSETVCQELLINKLHDLDYYLVRGYILFTEIRKYFLFNCVIMYEERRVVCLKFKDTQEVILERNLLI